MESRTPAQLRDALAVVAGEGYVLYPRDLAARFGINTAIFLECLTAHGARGASVALTADDVTAETGLSRYQQIMARTELRAAGVLLETRKGAPVTLKFRINAKRLDRLRDASR